MLAVGQPGELDAAPHIDEVDRGSRQLVHAGMAPRDDGRSDERYPPADHVDGNHVETLPLIRRELAKIRSQKVRKRTGSIDPFIPARKGRAFRALHDRRADDDKPSLAAAAGREGRGTDLI